MISMKKAPNFDVNIMMKIFLHKFDLNECDAAQSAVCKLGGLGPPKLNNEESLWPKIIKD